MRRRNIVIAESDSMFYAEVSSAAAGPGVVRHSCCLHVMTACMQPAMPMESASASEQPASYFSCEPAASSPAILMAVVIAAVRLPL
eukprot:6197760-Pleurochrysis_carterae.AAC.3